MIKNAVDAKKQLLAGTGFVLAKKEMHRGGVMLTYEKPIQDKDGLLAYAQISFDSSYGITDFYLSGIRLPDDGSGDSGSEGGFDRVGRLYAGPGHERESGDGMNNEQRLEHARFKLKHTIETDYFENLIAHARMKRQYKDQDLENLADKIIKQMPSFSNFKTFDRDIYFYENLNPKRKTVKMFEFSVFSDTFTISIGVARIKDGEPIAKTGWFQRYFYGYPDRLESDSPKAGRDSDHWKWKDFHKAIKLVESELTDKEYAARRNKKRREMEIMKKFHGKIMTAPTSEAITRILKQQTEALEALAQELKAKR